MIKKITLMALVVGLYTEQSFSITLSGEITTVTVNNGATEYGIGTWYSNSASYVNGGLTFTFPAGLFSQTPNVAISVQGTYSALTNIVPVISAISSTSVTIRVNNGTLLNIGEAATNAVTVHIHATGMQ